MLIHKLQVAMINFEDKTSLKTISLPKLNMKLQKHFGVCAKMYQKDNVKAEGKARVVSEHIQDVVNMTLRNVDLKKTNIDHLSYTYLSDTYNNIDTFPVWLTQTPHQYSRRRLETDLVQP